MAEVKWGEYSVHILPVLRDNYVYAITQSNKTAWLIDCGEARPISDWANHKNIRISNIIATHHHHDHVDGISLLKKEFRAAVFSSAYDQNRIPDVDRGLSDGDTFHIHDLQAQAMMIPGHTLGHMAIYLKEPGWLFSGDTWFGLGCGRLFEGTAEQLQASLNKLSQLPGNTQIFCGHEYTLRNAAFAIQFEPDNSALKSRILQDEEKLNQGAPTIPFSITEELATNPFLRTASPEIRHSLTMDAASELEIFRELRHRRNSF